MEKDRVVRSLRAALGLSIFLCSTVTQAQSARVEVCHRAPGKPGTFHTLVVSERVLQVHLDHGDLEGSCGNSGEILCDDGDACTVDQIDPATGKCSDNHPPVSCDDSNACTTDSCEPGSGCRQEPNICDNGGMCGGDICDERDGQTYATVEIGGQVWMAENLNYDPGEEVWCYGDDLTNCDIYGRLYTQTIALTDGGNGLDICPSGWHLPSGAEWTTLAATVGGDAHEAAEQLLAVSEGGSDGFGFGALTGGIWAAPSSQFVYKGEEGYFWTSSWGDSSYTFRVLSLVDLLRGVGPRDNGMSIRCVRD